MAKLGGMSMRMGPMIPPVGGLPPPAKKKAKKPKVEEEGEPLNALEAKDLTEQGEFIIQRLSSQETDSRSLKIQLSKVKAPEMSLLITRLVATEVFLAVDSLYPVSQLSDPFNRNRKNLKT